MTYFVSADTKISGEWIQLISRSVDIKDQSASQSVSLSVLDRQTDLKYTYIIILYNSLNVISLQKIKKYRKMDSTYITEYEYNGLVSQPSSHSVCLYFTIKLTSASRSICLSLTDRLTSKNDIYIYIYVCIIYLYNSLNDISLHKIRKYRENGFNLYHRVWILWTSQPANQSVSQSVCSWQTD